MKELKARSSRWFNKHYKRRATLWMSEEQEPKVSLSSSFQFDCGLEFESMDGNLLQ